MEYILQSEPRAVAASTRARANVYEGDTSSEESEAVLDESSVPEESSLLTTS